MLTDLFYYVLTKIYNLTTNYNCIKNNPPTLIRQNASTNLLKINYSNKSLFYQLIHRVI